METLKSEAGQRDEKLDVTEQRLDQAADAVDRVAAGDGDRRFNKTTLGGYAELLTIIRYAKNAPLFW